MKFSQALKANSVPDWRHHYVHYSRLKKMIFRLEQLQGNAQGNGSLTPVPEHRQSLDFNNPSAPLLDRRSPSMLQRASSGFDNSHVDELMFEREIHEELARVKAFYVEKVRKILNGPCKSLPLPNRLAGLTCIMSRSPLTQVDFTHSSTRICVLSGVHVANAVAADCCCMQPVVSVLD